MRETYVARVPMQQAPVGTVALPTFQSDLTVSAQINNIHREVYSGHPILDRYQNVHSNDSCRLYTPLCGYFE